MNVAECYRCKVGVDDLAEIACVAPSGDGEIEPEFIWCCIECLTSGDLVCRKAECQVD